MAVKPAKVKSYTVTRPDGTTQTYKPGGSSSNTGSRSTVGTPPPARTPSTSGKSSSGSSSTRNPNAIVLGGQSYSVDNSGNVYKNGQFVSADRLKYIPQQVLDVARGRKSQSSVGTPPIDRPVTGGGTGGGGVQEDVGTAPVTPEMRDALQNPQMPPPVDYAAMYEQLYNQQQQGMNQQLQDLINQFYEQLNGQSQAQREEFERLAREQAEAIAKEQTSDIEQLISELNSNQQFELDTIQNNLLSGRQAVEENTFLNWLNQRQDIANRGLGGSGIASDADTRLQLAANRDLQQLYNTANSQLGQTTRTYGNRLTEAYDRLSQINPELLESDLLQQMFSSSSESATERARILSDLIGQFLPYGAVRPIDLLQLSSDERQFYDKLNADQQQFYANLDSEERRFYSDLSSKERQFYTNLDSEERRFYTNLDSQERQFYTKLDSDERQFYANLDSEERQFAAKLDQDLRLGLANIMGVDPVSGQPTIDAMKLQEEIRRNKAQEGLTAAQIAQSAELGYARINADLQRAREEMMLKVSQMQQGAWADQAGMLNDQINNDLNLLDSLYQGLETMDKNSQAYKNALQQIQNVSARIDSSNATLDVFVNNQSSEQAQQNLKTVVDGATKIWNWFTK